MNLKIFIVNIIVPLFVILAISAFTGGFSLKKKESIKNELFDYFSLLWNGNEKEAKQGKEEPFFTRFFRMYVQAYEYELYKESAGKNKYNFCKLLVLLVILSIPFLILVMIDGKNWILDGNEWNNIYLYTVILVPLIFAYLVNKFINLRQYREIWYRHLRNRHYMEWRMMSFVKDFELMHAGLQEDGTVSTPDSLKVDFINDMCGYWKAASEINVAAGAKEENIVQDIVGLFSKS
ncbi:MAG: hypothetical protein IKF00_05195 [Solobacterium sp.]|nr:hypothetical protein [Solobacterium sp.]